MDHRAPTGTRRDGTAFRVALVVRLVPEVEVLRAPAFGLGADLDRSDAVLVPGACAVPGDGADAPLVGVARAHAGADLDVADVLVGVPAVAECPGATVALVVGRSQATLTLGVGG